MGTLSRKLYLYTATVIVAGWLILIYLTWAVPLGGGMLRDILFWVSLTVVMEFFPISLPRSGYITLSFPVIYAALLSSGPVVAGWAAVCGALFGVGLSKRLAPYKIFFNGAQLVLSVSAAWIIYRKMGGVLITSGSLAPFLAVVAAALAYSCWILYGRDIQVDKLVGSSILPFPSIYCLLCLQALYGNAKAASQYHPGSGCSGRGQGSLYGRTL